MKKLLSIFAATLIVTAGGVTAVSCANYNEHGFIKKITKNAYHLEMPDWGMMNDIQGAFYNDGKWHVYFLYNSDARFNNDGHNIGGNGTDWYHATTTNWVDWKYEGIAIKKFKTEWGDVASGTVINDKDNIYGQGKGSVIVYATGYSSKGQNTMAYVSRDGGYTFDPFDEYPILRNSKPLDEPDFRDPFIHKVGDKFVMYLAEKYKFGAYVSDNPFSNFEYKGEYEAPNSILECPKLLELNVNEDESNKKWVFFYSGNGGVEGTGTYFSIGTLNEGGIFVQDKDFEVQRLDMGPDYYGSTFWEDETNIKQGEYALGAGWMSNWAYSGIAASDKKVGNMSLIRKYKLRHSESRGYFFETKFLIPKEARKNNFEDSFASKEIEVKNNFGKNYNLKITIENFNKIKKNLEILIGDDKNNIKFDFKFNEKNLLVKREVNDINSRPFNNIRKINNILDNVYDSFEIDFFADATTIEVKLPDSRDYSMIKFSNKDINDLIKIKSDTELVGSYSIQKIN